MNNEKLATLKNRMVGINNWIESNPEVKDPNMYEMIDCVTNLGVLARENKIGSRPNKFPDPEQDPELCEVYREWHRMLKNRFGDPKDERRKDTDFPVNANTELYSYFMELNMDCCTGEFVYPEDEAERAEYMETLKKLGSVSLFINQQARDNKGYVYDNENEYGELASKVEKYDSMLSKEAKGVFGQIKGEIERKREYNRTEGTEIEEI